MAAGMQRVSKEELIQMLSDYKDDEYIGYIFTSAEDVHSEQHQVLVFNHAITRI